jgi:hypothetical protein
MRAFYRQRMTTSELRRRARMIKVGVRNQDFLETIAARRVFSHHSTEQFCWKAVTGTTSSFMRADFTP